MSLKKQTEDFYKRLEVQLEENTTWPSVYLYKFIVSNDAQKIQDIEAVFVGTEASISKRISSKGTYTSVSIRVKMQSPISVIEKYQEVSEIEGVISL
jgi:putative lipoic acid-binding regulatory protein